MPSLKINICLSAVLLSLLAACNSTTTIQSSPDEAVNTNGIYIAFNDNATSYRKLNDSTTIPLRSIKVIRFLSQSNGILIPESLTENETIDTNKIRTVYNYCLKFGEKNPDAKDYIQIKTKFEGDSIKFSQFNTDSEIKYWGVNYKDSIKLFYQLVYQGKITGNKPKELNFKFHKLY